jgi:hypothetical protein
MEHPIWNFVALYVSEDFWMVAKGYRLYKFFPKENKLAYFSCLVDRKNGLLSRFKLTRRLFRAEITHLYHFQRDTWMCIAKKAIFRYNKETGLFVPCCRIEKGSRPMNLCQDKAGNIYYGEYCYNPLRNEMRIFKSSDNGNTWNVVYIFPQGAVNHIHGLFADPYSDKIWVATGDDDVACIFGYTEDGFRSFVSQFKGSQQYRVCVPLFTEREIIYATDSQYEPNFIRSIDRETGEVSNLQPIQGSGIYAAMGDWGMAVSTTVEPSAVNLDPRSHLWISTNGHDWKELGSYSKDVWPKTYFQFGSLRFPTFEKGMKHLVFTGRSVRQMDGKTQMVLSN